MKNPLSQKVLLGFMLLAATGTTLFLAYQPGDEDVAQRSKPYFRHMPKKEEPKQLDDPGEFAKYHHAIRTKYGENEPAYRPNFAVREYEKAMRQSALSSARTDENARRNRWQSRGPFNVGGRTRTILPLPDDPVNHWLAGATGGGIWETTDGGKNWTLRTPNFPSLSITSLDYCEKHPNVIYAGTGEAIGLDVTFSAGVFKSRDGGRTWQQLKQTVNFDEPAVNRVVADPEDPDVFLYCASSSRAPRGRRISSSIYKATRGGQRITKVYDAPVENAGERPAGIGIRALDGFVQQILPDPTDFNVLYASANAMGVLRSTDRGETWELFDEGFSLVNGRIELAIAPTDPSRIYASAESRTFNTGSALYVSTDSAQSWDVISNSEPQADTIDYLGGQGWYDNTIMVNPFDEDDVYFGGVNLWRFQLQDSLPIRQGTAYTYEVNLSEESIIDLQTFLGNRAENLLTLGNVAEDSLSDVEIRFGGGRQQLAHRFTTNNPAFNSLDSSYVYQDYVPVPFEVWDVTNNRQLMVSFRDQQADGVFNLFDLDSVAAFEYVFIHDIAYANAPDARVAQQGSPTTGPFARLQYSVWPTLQSGREWTPDNLAEQTISIDQFREAQRLRPGLLTVVSDAYLQYTGVNSFFGNIDQAPAAFHPDHHELVPIDLDSSTGAFRILNGNDGGIFLSNQSTDPGINEDDWSYLGYGYVTGQFYGADKAPGEDRYVGGLQDQGSWASISGEEATAQTNYDFVFGGDGFEALWNSADINKILVTSQGGRIGRSVDGGQTFVVATEGIEGQGPFVTRLANSQANPGTVFAVTDVGVARSTDFGGSWTTVPITEGWGFVSAFPSASVEVSEASPDIVWAGQGMTPDFSFQVSTDRGLSYQAVSNYEGETLGFASGFATHPYEPNTAYALFSFAASPKILRTTDLGETWTDISGFAGEDSSATGFPDVAVYSLLVRPDKPRTLWVGTEIGIYESRDNGRRWRALRDFPAVPVWQMKVVDDQVVIATHGRGIFTTQLRKVPPTTILPQLLAAGTAPNGGLAVEIDIDNEFDSAVLLVNNEQTVAFTPTVGQQIYNFSEVKASATADTLQLSVRAYQDGMPLTSSSLEVVLFPVDEAVTAYTEDFNDGSDDFLGDFTIAELPGFANGAIHSPHPYGTSADFTYLLQQPVAIADGEATMSYRDIALVEPGEEGAPFGDGFFYDFVVVEGTRDGLNWVPLDSGYDATRDEAWLSAYLEGVAADSSLFRPQSINLQETFSAGDTILVRFRLFSDQAVTGYGWVIDDLAIQTPPIPISSQTPPKGLWGEMIDVYPNPTVGQVRFSQPIDHVYLYSLDGRFIRDKAVSREMDLSDLRAGTYLLKIEKEGATTTKRVLVQD